MTAHPPTARHCEFAPRALRAAVACASALAGCGPSSPPSPPSGGCKAQLLPGDLVITEVFADFKATTGDGSDAGREWFEIYNARGEPIDLEGLTLRGSRIDGSRSSAHTMHGATIAAGQYETLGNALPGHAPAYVDYPYGTDLGDLFNSDGGKLSLSCGAAEIDSAVYGDVKEGHARALSGGEPPDYTRNDDPGQWCQASAAEFEAGNFGTPGAENDCRPVVSGRCNDGGVLRDAVPPGPGDLVITELMPSPERTADATGEWIEARVMADIDLNGVALDRAGDTAKPDLIDSPDCLRVAAGSYIVFARSADPADNGGLPAGSIHGAFRFSLIPGSPLAPGDVAILAGTTVVDAVTWTRSPRGASLQIDPDLVDPIANDLESNFCAATSPYGSGDLGTPGAPNTACPALPPPGSCDDGGAQRAIASPIAGQLVITEVLANPANVAGVTDAQREWFEVTNTGATAFDLNELELGRIGAVGTPVQSARCLSVAPGGFAVLARSADPSVNGMLPAVAATFRFGLVDTAGDIQISRSGEVLDAVRWDSVRSGVAAQLDPAHLTAVDNDDPTRFCAATTAYGDGTNQGTPGAPNAPCR